MKLKLAAICSVTLLACAAASAPAFAGSMTWDFFTLAGSPAAPGASLGSSYTFTQGGQNLFAESAVSPGCSVTQSTACNWSMPANADLFAKNGGTADEQGLGLTGDPSGDYEIYYPNGVYLSLPTGTYATSVMIGSIQGNSVSGETWAVYGSNGGAWTLLGNGMGGNTADFNSSSLMGYSDLIVSDPSRTPFVNSNDVVLMSITTATTVPEPGTLALFGAGLLGCGLFLARRRRARQS